MRISIIGAGVTGQATGIGFSNKGFEIIFFDINKEKLGALKEKGYGVRDKIEFAVNDSDVVFVCVPTPTVDGVMDFSFLRAASVEIGKGLQESENYHLVVVRSTVLPSTTRCKIVPLLEQYSRKKAGTGFGVCMNPEFLREKSSLQDFLNPSRIVIGELDKRSGDVLEELYKRFDAPIFRMDMDHAEMVKYVSNLFLGSKISFFNEIFLICKDLGLNSDVVSRAVASDPRIGEYGVYGGRPFEGSCLPKDFRAFINFAKGKKINPRLLEEVLRINEAMSAHYSKSDKKD